MLLFALWILVVILGGMTIFYYQKTNNLTKKCTELVVESERSKDEVLHLGSQMHSLQKMLADSSMDSVTHLIGWQVFVDRVNQKLHESARFNTTLAIMHLDITNFHVFNDVFGAEVSQSLLLEAANRIQSCIRMVDSVSRSSSHRFSILLVNISRPESSALVVQRLLHVLSQPIQIKDHMLYLNVHFGIAVHPGDGADSVTLFSKAEQALELARKKKGGQGYQFYQESSQTKSQYELAIASGLMRDTLLQELDVLYHPIYDIQSKNIFCLQASFNWYDPQIGFVDSMTLFQYADQQGKSNQMVEWILRKASQYFLQWREQGYQNALLSLPISIEQLKNNHFIYRLTQLLRECHFKAEWLVLEVVHDASTTSFELFEKAINMLKYLNIKLAIRGFENQSFSIQQLNQLRAEYIILDRSLYQSLLTEPKVREMMKSLMMLSDSMSMRVIIKGLESEEEMLALSELGFQYMQGPFLTTVMSMREQSPDQNK